VDRELWGHVVHLELVESVHTSPRLRAAKAVGCLLHGGTLDGPEDFMRGCSVSGQAVYEQLFALQGLFGMLIRVEL
jgi:hypothetical protein